MEQRRLFWPSFLGFSRLKIDDERLWSFLYWLSVELLRPSSSMGNPHTVIYLKLFLFFIKGLQFTICKLQVKEKTFTRWTKIHQNFIWTIVVRNKRKLIYQL